MRQDGRSFHASSLSFLTWQSFGIYAIRYPSTTKSDVSVIIDEIQRRPELFPFLRVIADRRADIKLLILGSSSAAIVFSYHTISQLCNNNYLDI
jgi:hypothetical protein